MSQNVPPAKLVVLKTAARRRKIIELRVHGYTVEYIAKVLGVSKKTVDRDLKSKDIQDFTERLMRQQLVDVSKADLETRLQYRDKLLEKLMPQRVEQTLH